VSVYGLVNNNCASTSAHAVRGTNNYIVGSRVQTSGLIGAANGYDFYAEGAGTNYGPFTGAHDCLVANDETVSIGDLVVDVSCIARRGLSNTLFSVEASNSANQSAVLGVIVANNGSLSDRQPAAFIEEMTEDGIVMTDDYEAVKNNYQLMAVNAVGEGQIKVTGEGGDLAAGDLIVTSSSAGRGMKQSDNSIRSHTVARVRESVSFSSVSEVKLAACIYLCG
jgi:co-chaperonin GroES (HSP10)